MVTSNDSTNLSLNYISANRFYIEMQETQTISACFYECSGLSTRLDYETYQEGGVNNQQRIILTGSQFSEISLKRGLTNDASFLAWAAPMLTQLTSSSRDSPHRRNINILLFNAGGETIQCWTLIGAVPVAWKAPTLRADAATIAIEELSLAYEGLNVIVNSNPEANSKPIGGGATIHKDGRTPDSGGFFTSH